MITVKNLKSEYPKLDQKKLPAPLKADQFEFIRDNMDLYGDAPKITALIDAFVAELNKYAEKKSEPKKTETVAKPTEPAAKPKTKTEREKRAKKTTKPKAAPKTNIDKPKKPEKTKVSQNEMWFIVIRKFVNYVGNPVRLSTLYNFVKHFQRDFQENPNRTKTTYIKQIRYIQDVTIKAVNKNLKAETVTIEIPEYKLKQLQEIVETHKLDYTINKRALAHKPLSGTSKAFKNMDDALLKKKSKIEELKASNGIVSSNDLVKMSFDTLNFTGDWRKLIGKPTVPFHVMFYGRGGSGKSTIVMQFAHYLADSFGKKVLFVAKEEGQSGTTKAKLLRLKANHANIDTAEIIPSDALLKHYDVVVLDSVNELGLSPDDIRRFQKKHPKISTIQIFKVTKEGKFMGANDFQHMVQAEFVIENGEVHAEKNRFGGTETIKIKFEK